MGNISNRPTGGGGGVPSPHAGTHTAGRSDTLPWSDIHGYGLSSSRPIASIFNFGYFYFQTDTLQFYRSNGASWDLITQSGGSIGYGLLVDIPTATALNEGSLYYGTDTYLLYRSNGVSWDSLWNEASNVIYSNGTYPLLDNVKKALDQLLLSSGSTPLSATQVGFGSGSNLLSGDSLFTYDKTLATGGLLISNTTPSTSTTTGTLIINGGVGITGAYYGGGIVTALAGTAHPVSLEWNSTINALNMGGNNAWVGASGAFGSSIIGHGNTGSRNAGGDGLIVGQDNFSTNCSNTVIVGRGCYFGSLNASNSVFLGLGVISGSVNADNGVFIGMSVGITVSPGASSAVAIGRSISCSGIASIVIGRAASTVAAAEGLSLGHNVTTTAANALSIGGGSSAARTASSTAIAAISIGSTDLGTNGARASGTASIAIGGCNGATGSGARASAADAISIGRNAVSAYADSIALGRDAASTKTNQIVLGNVANHTEIYIPTTTASSSISTGSLVTAGGVGIAKELYVGIRTGTATKLAGFDANGKLIETSSSVINLVRFFGVTIGDGLANPISITHSLGTADLVVTVKNISTGNIEYPTIKVVDTNTITISFSVIPTLNQYRVAIFGGY